MILLLDVGNSQIFGGLLDPATRELKLRFRRNSKSGGSSDEIGLFLREVLRENGFDPASVKRIGICTVVPDVMYSIKRACAKYFGTEPFVLQAGVKTGLKIKYRNPLEVGADRISNSIAAVARYPGKNLIIVDLGTATTFCVVTADKEYLGGAILPGLKIGAEALGMKTAKLPSVEIVRPEEAVGRSTIESIQSGLYYGHVGAVKELIARMQKEAFRGERPFVIGTGGFSRLFENEGIFDVELPDLVLAGLYEALKMNEER